MTSHSQATAVHVPYAFSYADATAREAATGFTTADVGKLARQLDDNSLWMLTDDSPETWSQVGGSGGATLLYEAKRTTNLALTADTTAIDFNSVAVNVGSAWASGVFTAPSDGLYMLVINLCMTAATAYILRGYVNGTAKVDARYSSPGDQRHQAVLIEQLNAGDTLEARISATLTMDGSDTKFNWARLVKLA